MAESSPKKFNSMGVARREKLRLKNMEIKTKNEELEITTIVNIDSEDFIFHLGGEPIELKAGESKEKPIYVAKLGAKHLIDRLLQKKGIHDTLRDTPLRRDLMSQILPKLAEEAHVAPLSPEERQKALEDEVSRQNKVINDIVQSRKEDVESRDKLKEEIRKELLAELKEDKKKGRPAKTE